jgi:hypothetical protein
MYNHDPALTRPIGETFEECEVLAKLCAHQIRPECGS